MESPSGKFDRLKTESFATNFLKALPPISSSQKEFVTNFVAERMNRTLVETVRSMLGDANLPQWFWAEASSTAVYLRNRSPTKAVKGMTPFEACMVEKPKVDHLRVFGCAAHAHVPKEARLEKSKVYFPRI